MNRSLALPAATIAAAAILILGACSGEAQEGAQDGAPSAVTTDLSGYGSTFQDRYEADPSSYPQKVEYFSADGKSTPAKTSADTTYMACSGSVAQAGGSPVTALVIYAEHEDGKVYFSSTLLDDDGAVHASSSGFPQVAEPRGTCPLTDEVGDLGNAELVVVSNGDSTTW